jgi:hypothetical protein
MTDISTFSDDLQAAIAPYSDHKHKPPFSIDILIIMALASKSTTGPPMTEREIFYWILKHFPYYQDLATDAMWDPRGGTAQQLPFLSFRDEFTRAFLRVDFPLKFVRKAPIERDGLHAVTPSWMSPHKDALYPSNTSHQGNLAETLYYIPHRYPPEFKPIQDRNLMGLPERRAVHPHVRPPYFALAPNRPPVETTYSISLETVETYLHPLFQVHNEKRRMDFFELPPELRNRIYQMVFRYPPSGFAGRTRNGTFKCVSRSPVDSFHFSRVGRHNVSQPVLETLPLRDILGPLLVSRQFYQEAMPFFYNIHHFHWNDLATMKFSLGRLAPSRRKHIGSVSATYLFVECEYAANAFEFLLEMPKLRGHFLQLDEYTFGRNWGGRRKKEIPFSIPGLDVLLQLKLDDVVFEECPKLAAALKDEMTKGKAVVKGKAGSMENEKKAKKANAAKR